MTQSMHATCARDSATHAMDSAWLPVTSTRLKYPGKAAAVDLLPPLLHPLFCVACCERALKDAKHEACAMTAWRAKHPDKEAKEFTAAISWPWCCRRSSSDAMLEDALAMTTLL